MYKKECKEYNKGLYRGLVELSGAEYSVMGEGDSERQNQPRGWRPRTRRPGGEGEGNGQMLTRQVRDKV